MSLYDNCYRCAQLIESAYKEIAVQPAPTLRQLRLLDAVMNTVGLSQTQLVAATGIDDATLAVMVRRMCRSGLIRCKRSAKDSRSYRIYPTDYGRRSHTLGAEWRDIANNLLLETLSPTDRQIALGLLNRLAAYSVANRI